MSAHLSVVTQEFDVVVVGSGVAGASAGAAAAREGARVVLVEKLPEFGGSAALSAGMFWTAPSLEAYRRRIPLGNAALGRRLVEDFPGAVDELRSLGVRVADEPTRDIMTFGIGYSTDILGILAACRETVEAAGGACLSGASVRSVLMEPDAAGVPSVRGVRVRIEPGEGDAGASELELRAPAVVLATGGFGRDPELLARYLGPNADRVLRRSNRGSVGDGLRLAREAGTGGSAAMHSFYGHLVPWPLEAFEAEHYLPYSQYYSGEAVLLNLRGRRFVDETLGDEVINQDLVQQPEARGVLVFDDAVRATSGSGEPFPGLGRMDRFEVAQRAGGRWTTEDTLEALTRRLGEWGLDPEAVSETLSAHARAAASDATAPSALGVPVSRHAKAPSAGPYHALMVQPSITFTFGGIPISTDGEALDPDGRPVPGLFAAGADIGGLSNGGYAGGLAPGYITGGWAGRSAAAHALTTKERPVAVGGRTKEYS